VLAAAVWQDAVSDRIGGGKMGERRDGPPEDALPEGLGSLDGPADEDLAFSGPGDAEGVDRRLLPDSFLPGGVDHTTAAAGAGGLGLVLLGIAGAFTRRGKRRRFASLDE
jgi:MYXO-CTERM domain-containing protein